MPSGIDISVSNVKSLNPEFAISLTGMPLYTDGIAMVVLVSSKPCNIYPSSVLFNL